LSQPGQPPQKSQNKPNKKPNHNHTKQNCNTQKIPTTQKEKHTPNQDSPFIKQLTPQNAKTLLAGENE
jgi:hypothetical protein